MRPLLVVLVAFLLPSLAEGQTRPAPPTTPEPGPPVRGRLPAEGTPQEGAPRQRPARGNSVLNGTFLATRIDNEALPLTDRVVEEDGTLYLVEFDRMVLALRDDNTFRASIRYRRTLFSSDPRGRSRAVPLQMMTVTGRYEIFGGEISFTPDPSKETRGLKMLAGNVRSSRELVIPFNYRNGTQERDRTLVMSRRDNIL